jgi:predicted PurR-regulated permease PerM
MTFVPLLVDQAQQLATHLPEIYERNLEALRRAGNAPIATAVENTVRTMSQSAGAGARTFFGGALTVVRGVLSLFGVIVLTAYMTMSQKEMKAGVMDVAAPRYRPRISRLLREIKSRLGQWLRGQLLLGAVIGLCSYVGLLLLHVRFSLVLAVLAGVTELIPIVGPIIGAVPAVIVAASDQPIMGLWVALMYIGIQQLENHLLVPRIMSQATGLSPVTVLVGLLVGARLAGLLGVFIAVPACIIVQVLVEDWSAGRKLKELSARREPAAPA